MSKICPFAAIVFIFLLPAAAFGAPDIYYQEIITGELTYRVTYLTDAESTVWWDMELPGIPGFGLPVQSLTYDHSIDDIEPPILPDGMIKSARLKLYLRNGADESITLTVDSIDLAHARRRHFLIGPGANDSMTVEDSPLADGRITIGLLDDDREFVLVKSVFDVTYKPATPSDAGSANGGLPTTFHLGDNFPNPFNPLTTFEYSLAQESQATIEIFNVTGQKVRTLTEGRRMAGTYQAVWDGTDEDGHEVASGLYLYRLQTADYAETKRMLLIK